MIDSAGYTASTPRYGQMIREANKLKRVEFCKQLIAVNEQFDDIIFTDEATVQLHDNKVVIYRRKDHVVLYCEAKASTKSPPVVKEEKLSTKNDLTSGIKDFWKNDLTVERCNTFIDHNFKVLPVAVFIGGRATGDLPKKIFPERSRSRSLSYFNDQFDLEEEKETCSSEIPI
ncbi:unnamed protein product [Mytilus coruscus]|uniref:Uncharacterized protein n=1 Tax=Mytilus coruscus TaxID=42192 RepID=A0A6J8E8R9_MYTCO|nr:unnamed protein product [Mytilus coruscus]